MYTPTTAFSHVHVHTVYMYMSTKNVLVLMQSLGARLCTCDMHIHVHVHTCIQCHTHKSRKVTFVRFVTYLLHHACMSLVHDGYHQSSDFK